jgi:hypothetical protein
MDKTLLMAFLAVALVQVLVGWWLYIKIVDSLKQELTKESLNLSREITTQSGELKIILTEVFKSVKEFSHKLAELENIERDTRDRLEKQIEATREELTTILKRIEEPINIDEIFSHDKKQ